MNTNLLDLNHDILEIIGDYLKKNILEGKIKIMKKLMNVVQIINGEKSFGGILYNYPLSFIRDE